MHLHKEVSIWFSPPRAGRTDDIEQQEQSSQSELTVLWQGLLCLIQSTTNYIAVLRNSDDEWKTAAQQSRYDYLRGKQYKEDKGQRKITKNTVLVKKATYCIYIPAEIYPEMNKEKGETVFKRDWIFSNRMNFTFVFL